MRSVRSLRKCTIKGVFKPVWLFPRHQRFNKSSSTCVENEQPEPQCESDPYDTNFEFSECDQYTKVTIIGAAGRVGRTLSLLLKTCPLVDHLCLFDIDKSIKGIGVDISHIDTRCSVSHVCGMKNIHKALDAPDVVVIAAGVPASPQLSGNKLFDKNAPIVAGISEACARFCPKACIVLITSPINSLLPVVGEVYQIITNKIPQKKLFGLTTLDVVRANTFVAEVVRKDPNHIIVPVVGGTSQETIVPVISQMKPCCKIKRGEMLALTECVKRAEGNLADCQNCGTRGASSLSTAYAAFRFTSSLVMALKGAENIVECAYVKSDVIPELEYLASPVKLGIRGIEYNYGYPPLSEYEVSLMEEAAPFLLRDIETGKCFAIQQRKKEKTFFRRCATCGRDNFVEPRTVTPHKLRIASPGTEPTKGKANDGKGKRKFGAIDKLKYDEILDSDAEEGLFQNKIGCNVLEVEEEANAEAAAIDPNEYVEKHNFFLESLWGMLDADEFLVTRQVRGDSKDAKTEEGVSCDFEEPRQKLLKRNVVMKQ